MTPDEQAARAIELIAELQELVDAPCPTCGHRLGFHSQPYPHECIMCLCAAFRAEGAPLPAGARERTEGIV